MKVIDIMQKLANGENIKKFRIDDVNYYVDKSNYICEEDETRVEWYIDDEWLNMDAEVIEEDKKIEKFETYKIIDETISELIKSINELNKDIEKKLNEIIDYINGEINE